MALNSVDDRGARLQPEFSADDSSGEALSTRDWGGLIFAAILLLAGGYFLLRNTLGIPMPDIDWNALWPILVILLGVGALARGWTGHSHSHHRRDRY